MKTTYLHAIATSEDTIDTLNTIKTHGAHITSKAGDIENDERSTSYFPNLEKRNYEMKHITKLNISACETYEDPKHFLLEETKYYNSLYTKNIDINSSNL